MENPNIRLTIGTLAFLTFAAFAVHGPLGAARIENQVEAEAASRIADAGADWARIAVDGTTIRLDGVAPDEEALRSVLDALQDKTARAAGLRTLIIAAAEAPPPTPAPETPYERGKSEAAVDGDYGAATLPPAPASSPESCREAVNRALNGRRITFQRDSAALSRSDLEILGTLAGRLAPCAGNQIVIEGHTDSTGSEAFNQRLSGRRAAAVADYLKSRATATIFIIRAYGESRPIASNNTIEGRRSNRRIDFVVKTDVESNE